MAGAAIFSYFLYKLFKRRPSVCFYIEAIVVVVAPIVILAYSYFQFERIVANASSFDTGGESGLSRVLSWYSGLMLYLDHPIFGVGPGNFVTLHKGIYLPYNYVHPWVADNISTLAGHSNVLETLVESGPFTLAAYFGMQLVVYGALFYGSVKNQDGRYAMFRTLYFCAAIGNIFISYYPIFLMYIIGILLFSIDRDIIGFAQRKIVTFATEFKSSVPSATRYRES